MKNEEEELETNLQVEKIANGYYKIKSDAKSLHSKNYFKRSSDTSPHTLKF